VALNLGTGSHLAFDLHCSKKLMVPSTAKAMSILKLVPAIASALMPFFFLDESVIGESDVAESEMDLVKVDGTLDKTLWTGDAIVKEKGMAA
jgi:hypothetical protein